jgi:antitoxin HicB
MSGGQDGPRDVDYYLKLPYGIELRPYDDGTWFARVTELPGCMTEADTVEEVMVMIRDAQREWIAACLEDGTPIPEPEFIPAFTGLRVDLPAGLKVKLQKRAEREGTSLRDLVTALLTRALDETSRADAPAPRRRRPRRASAQPIEVREP